MKSIEKCTLIYRRDRGRRNEIRLRRGYRPGRHPGRDTIPHHEPQQTLELATEFFRSAEERHGKLSAVGIASFGPVDLDEKSPTYGFITSTPKPGWRNTDLVAS
jgi:fructokinase